MDQAGAKALVEGTLKAFGTDHIDILGGYFQYLESNIVVLEVGD